MKTKFKVYIAAAGLLLLFVSCQFSAGNKNEFIQNSGGVYGTYYHATYQHPEGKDLQEEIELNMQSFERSLSTFHPNSVITRINKNEDSVQVDDYFYDMYAMAKSVSEITHGAFDITVAPLVNAWGFGFGNKLRQALPDVQSILAYIGYEKISLHNRYVLKSDDRILLDASAIAKGQSADVIGSLLESHGCVNYMIEIGGEVYCRGLNPGGELWRIGIDQPTDNPLLDDGSLQTIVNVSNIGLATSGNYRQFYYKDGKKYAHTINPVSGYPVDHNLLSATVIAPSCMQADAYATAFMVLGVDSSLAICNRMEDLECYLIYADGNGDNQVVSTPGFKKYLRE